MALTLDSFRLEAWPFARIKHHAQQREPPRWLVRIMKLIPDQKGESFEAYWRRTRAEEDAKAAEDERSG